MESSGVLKTKNGHIQYYISSDEKYGKGIRMLMSTKTKDGKELLQLDNFDVFALFKVCQEYVQEVQMKGK